MPPSKHVVRFDGWAGGEFGTLEAEEAGRRGGQMFAARNMVRYRNGLLGPRAGIKKLAITGVPAVPLMGLGFAGTPGADLWFVAGNTAYTAASSGGAAANRGAVGTADAPVPGLETVASTTHFATATGAYELDHSAGTLAALTGAPGGDSIALYGERLVIGGRDTQRIYFSEAADFNDWPALNYFDAGAGAGVAGLWAQRGHLTVALEDGSWWVVTGTPGTSANQRRVSAGGVHPWDFSHQAAALLGSDSIAFFPIAADYPASFNGAIVRDEDDRHLSLSGLEDVDTTRTLLKAVRGFRPEEVALLRADLNAALLHRHGVWTMHDFGVDLAAHAASDAQGRIFLASAASPAEFYAWRLDLARPAFVGDGSARPGDNSDVPLDAWMSTPEWWEPDGHEVQVRGVIVDFVKWSTGAAETNHFGVTVEALRRYDNPGSSSSAEQTFDEAGAAATVDGVRDRVHLGFGDQGKGGGFRIHLADARGVALRSITVVADVWERRL